MFGRLSIRRGPRRSGVSGSGPTPADVVEVVGTEVHQTGDRQEHLESLERALGAVAEFTAERSVPASALINPLLVVWEAAHALSPGVGEPVEALLTVAVHRSTLGADEVIACMSEVRALAIQEAVLSELVGG